MANQFHMLADPDGGCPCPWLTAAGSWLPEVTVGATLSLGQGAILGAVGSIGLSLSSSMSGGAAIEFGHVQNYEMLERHYKRLEGGTYELPSTSSAELRSDELMLILQGISLKSIRRRKRYTLQENNIESASQLAS